MNLDKCERCGATDTALYNDVSFDEDFTVCAACLIERNGIDEDFVEKKEDIPRWFESYTDDPSPQIVKSGPLYTTDLKRECAFINRLAFRYHRDEVDREFGTLLARSWALVRRWAAPRVWGVDLGRVNPIMLYTPFVDEKDFVGAQQISLLPLAYGESIPVNIGVRLDRLYFDTEFFHYQAVVDRLRVKVNPKRLAETITRMLT
jgi:hypothetical protein